MTRPTINFCLCCVTQGNVPPPPPLGCCDVEPACLLLTLDDPFFDPPHQVITLVTTGFTAEGKRVWGTTGPDSAYVYCTNVFNPSGEFVYTLAPYGSIAGGDGGGGINSCSPFHFSGSTVVSGGGGGPDSTLLWQIDAVDCPLGVMLPHAPAVTHPTAQLAPRKLPCVHLGSPTGDAVLCPTCTGRVSLKLFSCAVHGVCTQGKPAPGIACCAACPNYVMEK